ncbi:hypothetical protein [Floccifex sp.]|uniref:hypothetical protein n=1 Tax=Floccifex sp. TaxID=2815810 RepID=UPI003F0A03F5
MGMKANSGFFRGTSGNPIAGDASFMETKDLFLKNIRNRKDVDPNGKFDLIAHGTSKTIEVEHNGNKVQINSRTAAKLIRRLPGYKKGQPIRLLSCSTGSKTKGFAQDLANKLNVKVYAPSDILWAYPSGKIVVAPRNKTGDGPDLSKKGRFIEFKPGGNKKC